MAWVGQHWKFSYHLRRLGKMVLSTCKFHLLEKMSSAVRNETPCKFPLYIAQCRRRARQKGWKFFSEKVFSSFFKLECQRWREGEKIMYLFHFITRHERSTLLSFTHILWRQRTWFAACFVDVSRSLMWKCLKVFFFLASRHIVGVDGKGKAADVYQQPAKSSRSRE